MLNSRDEEDHVELSINPEFPTYLGRQTKSDIPKISSIEEEKSEPPSSDQAHGGGEPSSPLLILWKKPSTVQGIFANVSMWDKMFITSCIIAVLLDPLFFYVPYINEDNKCLGKDKPLGIAAILLRSLTDITFILNITFQIRELILPKTITVPSKTQNPAGVPSKDVEQGSISDWEESNKGECTQFAEEIAGMFSRTKKKIAGTKKKIAQKLPWLTLPVFIDILAVLPLPQVLIYYVFFEISGSGYLDYRHLLNTFLLAQYLPRIFRIYLSSAEFTKTSGIWVKGAFNFFLYIIASHVLGAFWYFFAIQRQTSCWHRACVKYGSEGCMRNFYCNENQPAPNATIAILDRYCPVSNITLDDQFNYGIFLDSITNGYTGHINFAQKFIYSFWWGLRNISNFGTNLTVTSSYVWENLFAILISIIGLLLFLYLIGNVQTLMQFETTKWEEIRRKMQMKERDLDVWMQRNEIPDELKRRIIKSIKKKLEEDKDANLENLFNILPWDTRKDLKRFLCMKALINEPMLKNANPRVVKMICDYLKPVMYAEKSNVFQAGEPLDMMLFITQGTVLTYSSSSVDTSLTGKGKLGSTSPSMITRYLEKGHSYGVEQLLRWVASPNNEFSNLPGLTENVRSHSKVEGFALMASDLSKVATKCKVFWDLTDALNSQQREEVAQSTIAAAVRRFRNQLQAPNKSRSKPSAVEPQNSPINIV